MVLIAFLGKWSYAYLIKEWIWVALLYYLSIQTLETAQRQFTDLWDYIKDNFLALGPIFVSLAVFAITIYRLIALHEQTLDYNQFFVLAQCTAFGAFDLFFGLVLSQVIAGAPRLREEIRA